MRRVVVSLALLFLAVVPAPAAALELEIVIVDQIAPIKSWGRDPQARLPDKRLEQVQPGNEFYFAFAARGLQRNASGKCHAWVDFEIRGPSGRLLMRHEQWPDLRRKIHPGDIGKWSLLLPPIDLTFGLLDEPGTWTIRATLTDGHSGQTRKGKRAIELIELNVPQTNGIAPRGSVPK